MQTETKIDAALFASGVLILLAMVCYALAYVSTLPTL